MMLAFWNINSGVAFAFYIELKCFYFHVPDTRDSVPNKHPQQAEL